MAVLQKHKLWPDKNCLMRKSIVVSHHQISMLWIPMLKTSAEELFTFKIRCYSTLISLSNWEVVPIFMLLIFSILCPCLVLTMSPSKREIVLIRCLEALSLITQHLLLLGVARVWSRTPEPALVSWSHAVNLVFWLISLLTATHRKYIFLMNNVLSRLVTLLWTLTWLSVLLSLKSLI